MLMLVAMQITETTREQPLAFGKKAWRGMRKNGCEMTKGVGKEI